MRKLMHYRLSLLLLAMLSASTSVVAQVTPFTLPRTNLEGSISNSLQLFLPADDPCAKQLTPDILLTYDDYKRYNFDNQAEVLFLLDYIKAQAI